AAPKLAWFQDVESMLNHHLAGLLGLGSLFWAGHQVHVSLPINQFLNAIVDPKEIPLPHEFILNRDLLAQLYPSFAEGATPFFTLNWSKYSDFLTFRGGLDPVPKGLWEILTTSWHAQLSLNLAMLGSLTIIVAHHMYDMPSYPYLATDYGIQLSLFTHHMWIGGFLIVGAAVHAAIFMAFTVLVCIFIMIPGASFVTYSIRNHGFFGASHSCIYDSCDGIDTFESCSICS
ncbi:photosystem I P700 apoprotein A1, partial [Tanacetum coccineum]